MTLQDFDSWAHMCMACTALFCRNLFCRALRGAWHSKTSLHPSMLQLSHLETYVLPETMWPVRIFEGLAQGLGGRKGQVRREEQPRCSRYSRVHL